MLLRVVALGILLGWSLPAVAGKGHKEEINVSEGTRLSIESPAGFVFVRGQEGLKKVNVTVEHGDCGSVSIDHHRDVLYISPKSKEHCGKQVTDIIVTAPPWMPLSIEGGRTEVEVEGMLAGVEVDVVDGEVYVHHCEGRIFLRSVQGEVEVEKSKGQLDVGSNNKSIYLSQIEGQILAETLNGNLRMESIASKEVEGLTLNGNILYDGIVDPGGNYYFTSHAGNVEISVPEDSDVTVSVASANGEFLCDYEIDPVYTQPEKRFTFTLGTGTGRLRIESFNGNIEVFDPKGGRRKRGR